MIEVILKDAAFADSDLSVVLLRYFNPIGAHETAEIGPFCYISSRAKIGANCKLIARVSVLGDTTLGEGNVVFPGACLGAGPQDHGNEFQPDAKLIIGNNNTVFYVVLCYFCGEVKTVLSVNGNSVLHPLI